MVKKKALVKVVLAMEAALMVRFLVLLGGNAFPLRLNGDGSCWPSFPGRITEAEGATE